MRLIDADKLLQEQWKVETKDMFHMTETVDVVSAIDIKEAPAVNAIPIEWIRDYTNKTIFDLITTAAKEGETNYPKLANDFSYFVGLMIKLWEKENERV